MGRHKDEAPINPARIGAAALAALVVGAAGTAVINHQRSSGDAPTTAATSAAPSCSSGTVVTVSTTPDMAPALTAVAKQLEGRGGSACVDYRVSAVPAGDEAQKLATGASGRPQVWVPDSPLWVDQVIATKKVSLTFGEPFASSPVGLAVPAPLVASGTPTGPRTWAAFLASNQKVAMSDPARSTASMLALVSARRAATKPAEADLLQRTIIELARDPQDERALMGLAALGSPSASVFPASEQQMFAERSRANAKPLSAVTIADGAPDFSYGVVAVPPAAGGQAAPETAVTALREALASQTGRAELVKAGFRVDGQAGPDVPGMVDVAARPTAVQSPSGQELAGALAAWNAVRRSMRMLAVIDVSGSMRQAAAPGMTRIQLAAGAASTALDALPDPTEVGVWVFSTDRGPNHQPWMEVSPVVTLGEAVDGRTTRDGLKSLAAAITDLPKGNTGLYSTISAAVQKMQDGFDPTRVNSVVLMTDGVNDDPGGMSKDALIAQLRLQASGPRPVRVVLVGLGPDTDMATLHEIARASGGSAYDATEPDAIQKVIVGALTARMTQASGTPAQ